MTSLVERVARALWGHDDDETVPFENADPLTQEQMRGYAQAAIAAIPDAARITRLEEALRLAVPIIEDEREIMFESFKQPAGRYKGEVIDREANKDIAKMDRALEAARAALQGESD